MADLIIRGVKMPDGCDNCGLSYFEIGETNDGELCTVLMCYIMNQGTNVAVYDGNRPSWCPIVPLPDGHGRLIDADAIDTTYSDPEVIETLREAPTVIPAEGGG